jgi:hypothetical protein
MIIQDCESYRHMVRVFLHSFSVLLRLCEFVSLSFVCARVCTHAERLEPVELLIQVGNNYNACLYVYILRVTSIKYRFQMNTELYYAIN